MYIKINWRVFPAISLAILLMACSGQRVLMPTPNYQVGTNSDIYTGIPEELKTTEVPLFYVTDRQPEKNENGNLEYGYQRSNSLAFGSTVIDLGEDLTWEQLLEASRTDKRLKKVPLKRGELTEIFRGPSIPVPYRLVDGEIIEEPEYYAKRMETIKKLRQVMEQQLARTSRKEVFVFVHGFHNDFNDAAFAMAELWHFMGRIGVPVVYTWPAGYPGLFGYTYDTESSEYTVNHFRATLKALASIESVERINIIAHSRGTDVAVNALRLLTIEARAQGLDPQKEYKMHNVVLAAPDLDVQIASQRMIGEHLTWSADRFTIYTSPADKAIGWADKVFRSPRGRLGSLDPQDLTDEIRHALEYGNSNFSIINFMSSSDKSDSNADHFGHSYFRDAPTVSSDLILMLRDDLDPGSPGRPLDDLGYNFWRIPPGYPTQH